MKAALLIIVIWLVASSIALAQETRVPVAVVHYGDDQVGQQVVFALEAAILESDSFRLVNDEPVPSFPRIVVYLVSVNTGTEFTSAISETFVYDSRWLAGNRIYIAASITACGLNWVVLCAETILSYIDDAVKYLRRKSPDLWRSLTTESNYSKQQIPNDSLSSDALTIRSRGKPLTAARTDVGRVEHNGSLSSLNNALRKNVFRPGGV